MRKRHTKTPVIFRVWKDTGEVIALFPTLPYGSAKNREMVLSYMRVGQHGAASWNIVISGKTRLARHTEYNSLKRELESIGHVLRVYQRRTHSSR